MKSSSKLLWAAVSRSGSIIYWHGSPVLCDTKRAAEVKSPIGKAVKVLVVITPT